jgi:predicted AAA+ superfamily ATPase
LALRIDLLRSSLQLELAADPGRLEALVGSSPAGTWILLDEVQKVPALLDEVHRLIEEKRWRFALCGSSARKLKRGGANLLAGRAVTLSVEPFSFAELGDEYDLERSLRWGLLPVVMGGADSEAATILDAYMGTYLREEIRAEGAVRSLPPFARFLSIAGLLNGQVLNVQNVARDAAVSRSTAEGYFEILRDTLLSHPLPAYRPGVKVREKCHPKFFWVDPGIARAAAGLLYEPADRTWLGAALETLVYHELRCFDTFGGRHRDISYYRTPAGSEIDFVVETRKRRTQSPPHVVCIEVKSNPKWSRKWERPMRDLADHPDIVVERMIGVYTGKDRYHFDGLDVLPVNAFLEALHAGEVF